MNGQAGHLSSNSNASYQRKHTVASIVFQVTTNFTLRFRDYFYQRLMLELAFFFVKYVLHSAKGRLNRRILNEVRATLRIWMQSFLAKRIWKRVLKFSSIFIYLMCRVQRELNADTRHRGENLFPYDIFFQAKSPGWIHRKNLKNHKQQKGKIKKISQSILTYFVSPGETVPCGLHYKM